MAITRYGAQRFSGLEADVNNLPIDADLLGAIFNSTDTLKFFIFNGTTWNESAGGGGITGLNPNSTILEYLTPIEADVFGDYTTPTSATATSPLVTNVTSLKAYYQYNNDPTLGDLINQATAVGSVDSVPDGDGTNTSVSSVTGLIDNAYDYSQSTLAMTVLGSSLSQFNFLTTPNEKWSMAFWLNLPAAQTVVGRYFDSTTTSFNKFGLSMFINTDRSLGFQFSNNSGAYYLSHNSASNFIPASPTDWFFIALTYDATLGSNQFSYSVNNGTPVLVSRASVEIAGDTTDPYTFGQNSVGGGNQPYIGLVDEWSIWNRLLTTQEITDLFNAGSGAVLGNNADNAIDKNTTTFWQSNAGINESITLDMGSLVNAYGLAYFISTAELFAMTETQFQIKTGGFVPVFTDEFVYPDQATANAFWTSSSAAIIVDQPNQELDFNLSISNASANESIAYDMLANKNVTVEENDWELVVKMNFSAFTGGNQFWYIGMSDGDESVGKPATQNYLGIEVRQGGADQFKVATALGTGVTPTGTGTTPALATGTDYWFVVKRITQTTLTVSIFLDSALTNLLTTTTETVSASITGLNFIKIQNLFNDGSTGTVTGTSNFVSFIQDTPIRIHRTIDKTELTPDQYNFIRFNGVHTQLIQIEGSSGSSLVMAANELAVQIEPDPPLTTKHGQFTIPTIAGTPLNGGDPTSSVIEDPNINTLGFNNVSTPADPELEKGLMWLETSDGSNNIINAKVKKDGVIETFQVVPPLFGPSDPVITAPDGTQGTLKMTNDGRMTIVPL